MNWAESIYIKSGLRTKRLRQHVIPKLIALGGRTEGLEVLDIGCGPGECVAGEIEDFGAVACLPSILIRRWSNVPRGVWPNMEVEQLSWKVMSPIFPTRRSVRTGVQFRCVASRC